MAKFRAPHLGFGLGTVVQCDAEDKSLYCQFAKLMNVLVWVFLLVLLIYVIKGKW